MRQHLTDINNYTRQAAHELNPTKGGDGRSQTIPIGIRLNALDLITGNDILPTLEEWERDWRHTYGLTPYGPATAQRNQGKPQTEHIFGVLQFLNQWLDQAAATHPAIADFATELRALRQQAQHAANQQPRQSWNITCPTDHNENECGNVIRVSGEDFGTQKTCRRCRTVWEVNRLIQVAASSSQASIWLDPQTAATQTGISERTLRSWAQAGRVDRRNGMYDYRSLVKAVRGD